MAKRISLSRAARLVGVKRGVLQQKIRAGELQTFEGDIVLSDLLHAYPNAQVEDSSMLERVEQIIEQATFINPDSIARKPDNVALTARIMSLSEDLSRQKRLLGRYQRFTDELRSEIGRLATQPDGMQQLDTWVEEATARISTDDDTIDQPFANETFLRVMSAQATVIPSGHEFFVEGAESILEAGLRGGLALNYGCSNGNCGLCKIRVVSGETRKIKYHDYVLTEAEKGIGYILGCCNTAISDVVLEADEAQSTNDIPTQNIPIRIKRIDHPNPEVLIVSTRTPRTSRLRFLAGQRATLSIDNVGSGFYPIASCPCDDMNLQFHIGLDQQDPVASYLDASAKANDLLTLEGPVGSFVLNENSPNSLIFIAEGIGFASIKGLIEHAMALDVAEKIFLFWIAGSDDSHYLNNLCRAWNDALDNFEYVPLNVDAGEHPGDSILEQLNGDDPSEFDYYLCSGADIRAGVEEFIETRSIPRQQVLLETI
ncbi:MAG: 2Fe-2S iron-sulfur cluster-binding protein [Gammaproteobacteria bacterium]|nr:2Fe-2S iron-sulfur cluster-binding protein [Gammaproteobacteria bacterium]MDH3857372.1 2Fe-2S iron-sulfur cluster-binding protein [Gammaproteobacteria bacterium]